MKEFCNGTVYQFHDLTESLADGMCHVYNNCILPSSCTPQVARLGFERTIDEYIVYIDKGIKTTKTDETFCKFLDSGEARFPTMDAVMNFFYSLRSLYEVDCFDSYEEVTDLKKLKRLNKETTKPIHIDPSDLSLKIKNEIFGQDIAVDCLAEKIAINLAKKSPKLLAIVLMGPTATGKSETAKGLAKALSDVTGHTHGFINVSANEFIGEHTVNRFFGAPPGYVGHGQPTVFDPIRKNPYHVVIINEIEKGDLKVLTGLMEAIDTGFIGMADNSSSINMNHSILLFTSNIPVDMEQYRKLSPFAKEELCRDSFTQKFGYPEIAGKIGNFIAFDNLDFEARAKIIIKFVRMELENYNLQLAHIDEELMCEYMQNESKYGARGIRGLVSNSLGRKLLMIAKDEESKGKFVSLSGKIGDIIVEIMEDK